MDIYETPIVTYENTRPIQYRETKSPESCTPRETPMIQKEYKTPRWMLKAMIGMAVLIVVMLAGIVVGVVLITREREEIKEIRNGQQALAKQHNDSGYSDASQARKQDARIVSLEQILNLKLRQEYSGASQARKQDARIVSLERTLTTMNTSFQQAKWKLGQVESDSNQLNKSLRAIACDFWYNSKCFLPLKTVSNHASARKLCKEFGGGLANIYSSNHLFRIMTSIRLTKMNGQTEVDFHLGMKIVPSNASVTLSDGAPAPYLKWDDSYPSTHSSRTLLFLRVNRDSSSTDQNLWNVYPTSRAFVLCEIA